MMSFFLHELIALEFGRRYPNRWRGDIRKDEKDLVFLPDVGYSVEIKGSSDPNNVYGNRSYAQPGAVGRKGKSGYYLTVNFQSFSPSRLRPSVTKIKFGWLDHTDWRGQAAATGQQASLTLEAKANKLVQIFPGPTAS